MNRPPRHLHSSFAGLDEACLSFGDAGAARRIMLVPPLFDEMNRVRSVMVGAMRALAERGVATLLPDLTGCNESVAPMSEQSITSWQAAMAAAVEQLGATHVASIRGGGLLVAESALPHWRLAAVSGSSILKTMLRTRVASDKEAGIASNTESLMGSAATGAVELSGYRLSADMLAELQTALPGPADVDVILGEDAGQLAGAPLWLRAEPKDDAAMSAALAAELDRWSATCGK